MVIDIGPQLGQSVFKSIVGNLRTKTLKYIIAKGIKVYTKWQQIAFS